MAAGCCVFVDVAPSPPAPLPRFTGARGGSGVQRASRGRESAGVATRALFCKTSAGVLKIVARAFQPEHCLESPGSGDLFFCGLS